MDVDNGAAVVSTCVDFDVDNVDTKLHCYNQVGVDFVDLLTLKVANLWEEYQNHPQTEQANQLYLQKRGQLILQSGQECPVQQQLQRLQRSYFLNLNQYCFENAEVDVHD